jgi:hypothetical protein
LTIPTGGYDVTVQPCAVGARLKPVVSFSSLLWSQFHSEEHLTTFVGIVRDFQLQQKRLVLTDRTTWRNSLYKLKWFDPFLGHGTDDSVHWRDFAFLRQEICESGS